MVSSISCQNCGEQLDASYGRVFGADDGSVYACPNCSTHRAVAHGAAVAPNRDGTPLAHRPGGTEPVTATVDDEDSELKSKSPVLLTDLGPAGNPASDSATETIDDEAFAELVAE